MAITSGLTLKDFKVGDLIYYVEEDDFGGRHMYCIIVEIKEGKVWSSYWNEKLALVLQNDYKVPKERETCMEPDECFKLSNWREIMNHKNGRS